MSGTYNILRSLLTLALVGGFAGPSIAAPKAEAGESTVEVSGESAIVGGNKEAAKEKAKNLALREAVEQVAGTMVTGISESKDWMSVRDEVSSQSSGYVSKFEVLKRSCGADTCTVKLRATVAKGKLRDRLDRIGLLIQKKGYPRVLMLVAEQNADSASTSYWWGGKGGAMGPRPQAFENELASFLNQSFDATATYKKTARGKVRHCLEAKPRSRKECWKPLPRKLQFRFFDYTSLASHPLIKGMSSEKISDEGLLKIGKLSDAEIIIYGTARATLTSTNIGKDLTFGGGSYDDDAGSSVQMQMAGAAASLRIINIHTGQILGTGSVSNLAASGLSANSAGSKALRAAARKISIKLKKVLADTWQSETSSSMVKFDISGIKSYGDLMKFKTLLGAQITGVQSVQQRGFGGGKASLEVDTSSGSEEMAAELSTKKLGPFSVSVLSVNPGTIQIKISR